jgi:DNA-binding MarR family transcriptional regulator
VSSRPRRTIQAGPAPRDSIDRVIAGWAAVRPDLDVAPVAVISRLARVNALVREELDVVFAQHGITADGFALLATLVRLGAPHRATAAQLLEELGAAPDELSSLAERLARSGLVRRTAGADAIIEATPDGLELFEGCAPDHLATEARLVASLTEDERDALAILLRKLLVSLETGDELL